MSLPHTPETQAIFSNIEQNSIQQTHSQERDTTALNSTVPQERLILESMLEDSDEQAKVMRRVRAVEDISQAPKHQRREKIKLWADRLEVHPRTVTRLLERVEKEGLASLVRFTRIDAGETRGSKQWQEKSVAEWTDFILTTYKRGNKSGRRMNRSQVFNQVKAHAVLELGLSDDEYPSSRFVYGVLNPLVEQKKEKRNPGQGPGIVIKTIDRDKQQEDIVVERSNQVWQIDHTKLDNLLVDADENMVGCVWITSVIDSYSSCIMGYYLSFMSAGSHEVALALRHAILPKHYGAEYELQKEWEVCGLPEYIVTDRAKEFKSGHLRRVAMELGFKLRLRLHKEQGGIVESSFRRIKDEFSSLLPGYKGGTIEERPENAEKYACMIYEEYDRKLVRHFVDHANQHLYWRIKNQTCLNRWWNGIPGGEPRRIEDKRKLDVCLMKEEERTVQKYGCVTFENLIYSAGFQRDEQGYQRYDKNIDFLAKYNGKVTIRYDPSNIVRAMVYTLEQDGQPSKYLGVIRARDLSESRLSLREWKEREKQIRTEGKAIDQTSILAQQRDLNKFAVEKVKEMRRKKRGKGKEKTIQKRRDEHQRIVEQTPDRNELGKALPASEGINKTEGVDRLLIAEVVATDASIILPIDNEIMSVPLQAEVNQRKEEDRSATIEKLKLLTTPQRIIQPALLVVSSSDSVNDDDW
jgi:putative transposase